MTIEKCANCLNRQSNYDMVDLDDRKNYCYSCIIKWAKIGKKTLEDEDKVA